MIPSNASAYNIGDKVYGLQENGNYGNSYIAEAEVIDVRIENSEAYIHFLQSIFLLLARR